MSEQEYCNSADTFGVRLVNHVDDAVMPVGVHDFADAIGRCMLIDKTMFIADVLDCDASVVVCCRPEGFGKSMNLSMLRAFLERPAVGRAGRRVRLLSGDIAGLFWRCEVWPRCCRRRARCPFGRVRSLVGALGGSGFSSR